MNRVFFETIEAWVFSPVVPLIYYEYQIYAGLDIMRNIAFTADKEMTRLVTSVLNSYAQYSTSRLVEITKNQSTWINTYKMGGRPEIMHKEIKRYFSSK